MYVASPAASLLALIFFYGQEVGSDWKNLLEASRGGFPQGWQTCARLLAMLSRLDQSHVQAEGNDPRALWGRQDVSQGSIREYWTAIRDRRWAAADNLERCASSETGQRLLLQAGLRETEAALTALPEAGGSSDRRNY